IPKITPKAIASSANWTDGPISALKISDTGLLSSWKETPKSPFTKPVI
ncbi:peptidoglycan-binding LysM, partial [Listeria monocytogenes FSL F2-208]